VEVRLVNVDVVATDRKGRPVTDLGPDDFVALEDGRPVEISHFSVRGSELSAIQRSQPSHHATSPGDAIEVTSLPTADEREPLWLAVYVDQVHTRLFEQTRAISQLKEVLAERVHSESRVMVASYGRGLKIHQTFTTDPALAVAALDELQDARAEGGQEDDERRRLLRVIETAETHWEAMEAILPYADRRKNQLHGSLNALEEMIDLLSGLPGRKVILFASGGLPLKPAAELFMAIEYKFPIGFGTHRLQFWDCSTDFGKLTVRATENDVALYPLDAAGIRPARSGGVEEELRSVPMISANFDSDVRQNLQLSLRQLADDTGGKAILNRNNFLPALQSMTDELRSYYSLGYTPARPGDDRYHKIKIKVKRPGVRLRHRQGYRDKSPETRIEESLRAALAHGFLDNGIGLGLYVGPASEVAADRFDVPVRITLPLRSLAFSPQDDGYTFRFRVFLAAKDAEGGFSDVLQIPASLTVDETDSASAQAAIWRMSQQIKMRGGEQRLAVAVQDELSPISGITAQTFVVAAPISLEGAGSM